MRPERRLLALLPFALAASPLVAGAQLGATLPGTWRLSGGWVSYSASTDVRIDSDRFGRGTTVNLEDDLGFASSVNRLSAALSWQFAAKHSLELSADNLDRTSVKNITRELTIGDQTYPLNSKIGANFTTQIIRLRYQYAFFRRDGFEAGPGVDVPIVFAKVVTGVELPTGTVQKQQKDWTVPPPLPSLYFSARLHPTLYLQGTAAYMKATIFGLDVDMTEYRLSGTWLPTTHVGGGLAWSGSRANIARMMTNHLSEKFSYAFSGPSLFVTLRP